MADTAKRALKPYVEAWLGELDACYEMREVWCPQLGRQTERRVLVHPPPAEHTGRLHRLIQADYSPLVPASQIDAYMSNLEASAQRVPLERKNFPADYYWSIIKKWNRWRKLRVIARLDQYAKDIAKLWEDHWRLHGGDKSPYTRQWIQYENLVDAYRRSYGGGPDRQHGAQWDQEFPVVAVMRRMERGEAPRGEDIATLEPLASPWCRQHVSSDARELMKKLRSLDTRRAELRDERIDDLRQKAAALYAALLAQDIQARHERALHAVNRWNSGWGDHVAAYFRTLGNRVYIRRLRKVMPMPGVGDPEWAQKARMEKVRRAGRVA
jgi:hypothetical protein